MLDMDSDMAYIQKNKDLKKKESDKVITLEDIGIDVTKVPPKALTDQKVLNEQKKDDFHHSKTTQSPSSDMFEDISHTETSVVLQDTPITVVEELDLDATEDAPPSQQSLQNSDEEYPTSTPSEDSFLENYVDDNQSFSSELTFEHSDKGIGVFEDTEAQNKSKEDMLESQGNDSQESSEAKEINLFSLPSHFQLSEPLSPPTALDTPQPWNFEEKKSTREAMFSLENNIPLTESIDNIPISSSLEETDEDIERTDDEEANVHPEDSLNLDELEITEYANAKKEDVPEEEVIDEEEEVLSEEEVIDTQVESLDEEEEQAIPLNLDEIAIIKSESIDPSPSFIENTRAEDTSISLNAGELDINEDDGIDLLSPVLGNTYTQDEEESELLEMEENMLSLDVDEINSIASEGITLPPPTEDTHEDEEESENIELEEDTLSLDADEINSIASEGITLPPPTTEDIHEDEEESENLELEEDTLSLDADEIDIIMNESINPSPSFLEDAQDKNEDVENLEMEEDRLSLDADEINSIASEGITLPPPIEDTHEEERDDSTALDASELDIIVSESNKPSSSFLEDTKKEESRRKGADSVQSFHHYAIEIEHKARIMEIKLKRLIRDNKQINRYVQEVSNKS